MEAGEYRLRRGTCFVASRLESRGGRGRRAAVDFVLCFGWGGFFRVFFPIFLLFERTRPAASMRAHFASFTSLLVFVNGLVISYSWACSLESRELESNDLQSIDCSY